MWVSPPRGDIPPWPLIPGVGGWGSEGTTSPRRSPRRSVIRLPYTVPRGATLTRSQTGPPCVVGCDKRGRATGEGRASWSWVITCERQRIRDMTGERSRPARRPPTRPARSSSQPRRHRRVAFSPDSAFLFLNVARRDDRSPRSGSLVRFPTREPRRALMPITSRRSRRRPR